MTAPEHDAFTLTRTLSARPADVFALWSDAEAKKRWFVDSDGPEWTLDAYELDFRVGGQELGRFELTDGPGKGLHENRGHYLDIVPNERIAFAYTMALDGRIHSASLATVTFTDEGGGTRLTYHEQIANFPPSDGVEGRRGGWTHLITALERELERGNA